MFSDLLAYWERLNRVDLSLVSAGVAFFGFLSIFPAIAATITIWGFAFDPAVIQSQLDLAEDFLPAGAYDLLYGQVQRLLATNTRSLGLATILSALLALWSSRAGVGALISGLNALHDFPARGGVRHVIWALVLTVTLIGLVLAAMALTVVLPLVLAALPMLDEARITGMIGINYVLGLLFVVIGIALTYRLGPNWPKGHKRPRILSPGLVIAVLLWVAVSRGLVFYLANFGEYNKVYGSIGAVVALMFWFYLSAYSVLLGAAINAVRRPPPQ
ncbi:MAG: YihY/virulence factor BrkB family protein [Pseudorhodobacter sp.]